MATREDIVLEARKWLGVPWRHLGRNRAGIDCVGLGIVVCKAVGIQVQDLQTYSRVPNASLIEHLYQVAEEISFAEAKPGDFYAIKDRGYPFHVAFKSEKYNLPHIIHAHAQRRMVVEEPFINEWPSLVTHAFRLGGLE